MVGRQAALALQSILRTRVREQPLGLADQAEIPGTRSMHRSQDANPSLSSTFNQGRWGGLGQRAGHPRCGFQTLGVTDPLLTGLHFFRHSAFGLLVSHRAAHHSLHVCFSFPSTSAMSLLYECVNTVIAGENQLPGSETGGCHRWEALPHSHPGGGSQVGTGGYPSWWWACNRLIPDGCPQALPL